MARTKVMTVNFRRRRERKTDYRQRLQLLKSGKPRLVIRMTLKNVRAQIIEFKPTGDRVILSAESRELQKHGWKYSGSNIPAAYLVGLMIGKKASDKKIGEVVLDIGLKSVMKGSKLFAALKGAVDAGLNVPHSPEILPDDERVSGKHIVEYAKTMKGDKESLEKRFGKYIKNGVNPEDMEAQFNKVKETILKA